MKMSLTVIAALVALIVGAFASRAADVSPQRIHAPAQAPAVTSAPTSFSWTGGTVGAFVGYGFANHEVNADIWDTESGQGVELFKLDGIGGTGGFVGLSLGGDYDAGPVVLRTRVDYAISSLETSLNVLGDRVATVEKGDEVIAWAGLGAPLGKDRRTLVYGLAGWASTEFTLKTDDGKASRDFSGPAVALGVEHAFDSMFSAYLEAQGVFYDKETLARGEGFAVRDEASEFRALIGGKVRLAP